MDQGITFALWGLGGSIVTGLVLEVLKRVWLKDGEPVIKDRWAVVASLAIGVILSVIAHLGELYPLFAQWSSVIGAGALAGLAACGLYSLTKPR